MTLTERLQGSVPSCFLPSSRGSLWNPRVSLRPAASEVDPMVCPLTISSVPKGTQGEAEAIDGMWLPDNDHVIGSHPCCEARFWMPSVWLPAAVVIQYASLLPLKQVHCYLFWNRGWKAETSRDGWLLLGNAPDQCHTYLPTFKASHLPSLQALKSFHNPPWVL